MTARAAESSALVFVDGASVKSGRSFVTELAWADALEVDLESDISQTAHRFTIFTSVNTDVAAHLLERKAPFALLAVPLEDYSGLSPGIVELATAAVAFETALEYLPDDVHSRFKRLPGYPASTTKLASPKQLSADASASAPLAYPTDYLALLERFATTRRMPAALTILADSVHAPPAWMVAQAREYGSSVRLEMGWPYGRRGFVPDAIVRQDPAIDAIDVWAAREGIPALDLDGSPREQCLREGMLTSWREAFDSLSNPREPIMTTGEKRINIVCSNLGYLFEDLVKRFVRAGCHHSELPDETADAHIWLRPQEMVAFLDMVGGGRASDLTNVKTYQSMFESRAAQYRSAHSVAEYEARAVPIHHGTCFPPIYQFEPYRLARRLSPVAAVAGVCEFVECYGPSASEANPQNFEFIPIGYDHTLFAESVVRTDVKEPGAPLRIGFVGRAYGTSDPEQLRKNIYAHPPGYRKGGDYLLNILLRLKALGLPFSLHVIGLDWDGLARDCAELGISFEYLTRGAELEYVDYPRAFASFDVLLIPARGEGGPVTAIEAMSVGVPVVGTDVGVLPFLARTTSGCQLFTYDTRWHTIDVNAAVAAIRRIHESEVTHESRLAIRNSVAAYTTDAWIEGVKALAVRAAEAASVPVRSSTR
jgi:glycosyltransferase involved in cell wall biosynthesis